MERGALSGHLPVMYAQVLDGLNVRGNGTYLDGTFGRGGHARGVLERLGPGGRLLLMDKDPEAIAVAMAGANMKEAKDQGADFMVTPCPLCQMSLDIYQERAGRAVNASLELPILHLPQLLGLAIGIPARDLGVARHLVPVDSIVRAIQQREQQIKEPKGVRS